LDAARHLGTDVAAIAAVVTLALHNSIDGRSALWSILVLLAARAGATVPKGGGGPPGGVSSLLTVLLTFLTRR